MTKTVLLVLYLAVGSREYGGGPAIHAMSNMAACRSAGEQIVREFKAGQWAWSGKGVWFTCVEVQP